MTRRYFGTDGIRGRVGDAPMTPEFVLRLGWAAGRVLTEQVATDSPNDRASVLIGKDTRLSGYMLESALEAGFAAAGVNVMLVGPMPTPAIAYLSRTFRVSAGVVISASHNPFHDNGIKFFSGTGCKLPDAVEARIEDLLDQTPGCVRSAELGRARRVESAPARYIEFCKGTFRADGASLAGLRLVVDCANGASYHVAPHVFGELGAEVDVLGDQPDGLNINRDCGSTHPQALQDRVRESGAHAGIALDGDGDRCLMVDGSGQLVDGDELLYIIALSRQAAHRLQGPVVGTTMSNLGLAQALERENIPFERAKVGDRYVFERLQAAGGMLGGEASGHILCLDRASTGDGIIAALQVLAAMVKSQKPLADLAAGMDKCPQTLLNVSITRGQADQLMQAQAVTQAVANVEKELADAGRVLLRPSGTEPLIRVMVEGHDAQQIDRAAEQIAAAVRAAAA